MAVLLGGLCGLPHRCVAMGLDPPVLAPLLCLAMHMGGTWGTGLTYGLWLRHMSPCHGFGETVHGHKPQDAYPFLRHPSIQDKLLASIDVTVMTRPDVHRTGPVIHYLVLYDWIPCIDPATCHDSVPRVPL